MCCTVWGTIIENWRENRWCWLFYLLRMHCCLRIYIPGTKGVFLALSDFSCSEYSACSVLPLTQFSSSHWDIQSIGEQPDAEGRDLATPRHTIDWWRVASIISVALPSQTIFATGLDCLIGFSLLMWDQQRCLFGRSIAFSALGILPRNSMCLTLWGEEASGMTKTTSIHSGTCYNTDQN